jgi:hypothetical protein
MSFGTQLRSARVTSSARISALVLALMLVG